MPACLSDLQSFEISDEIRIEESTPGYPVIQITNQQASATIALHGAHLTHYQPHGQAPVIFTSKAAILQEGKAIRGGIPICWPWFGAYPDSTQNLPAHGYARTTFWQLISTRSEKNGTYLTFSLPRQKGQPLTAEIEFFIGADLTLKLTSHNLGTEAELMSEALHSYFAVGDTQQTHITGLEGDHYLDTTGSEETTQQQSGQIDFPDEIDRIYHSDTSIIVKDSVNQRNIIIDKQNSQSTIVWNPGKEKGGSMADLLDEEIQQFVCAESANVRAQSLTLKPDESHTLTLTISTQV